MNWFFKLNEIYDKEDVYDKNKKQLLDNVFVLSSDVPQNKNKGMKRYSYLPYDQVYSKLKSIPKEERNWYTIIPLHCPVDLVFDLDMERKDNPQLTKENEPTIVECCLKYIVQCIQDQLDISNPSIVIWKSSFETKMSYHIHVIFQQDNNNKAFEHIGHMGRFAWFVIRTIYDAYIINHEPEAQRLMVSKTDKQNNNKPYFLCILDHNVYKKNGNFRLPLCSKYGKNTYLELHKPQQELFLYNQYFPHHLINNEKELFNFCLITRNRKNEKENLQKIQFQEEVDLPFLLNQHCKNNHFMRSYDDNNIRSTQMKKRNRTDHDDDDVNIKEKQKENYDDDQNNNNNDNDVIDFEKLFACFFKNSNNNYNN